MSTVLTAADVIAARSRSGLTPLARYLQDLRNPGFIADPAQERAVRHLQRLYNDLQRVPDPTRRGLGAWVARVQGRAPGEVRGVYLWGGVGRGKTYLADSFYDCLGDTRRLRQHFHRFMASVHEELDALRDVPEPLSSVAEQLARRARVILLDEFYVQDIGDAMLVAGLLRGLFARGVALVATSNVAPADLYRDGLQRARFLPAIALIERHMEVVATDGGTDYRLRGLESTELYHSPLDDAAEAGLAAAWARFAPEPGRPDVLLALDGREVLARRATEGVVWFDFAALCDGPRGTRDYIELARCHHTVLLSGVPQMTAEDDDKGQRFIRLIDVLYDRNVKLLVAAAVPARDLYRGHKLGFEFERAVSRLTEMQTHAYLARTHLP